MCFSASASFGAGIVLAAIAVASIKQVQHKSQIVFACIPLFFSAQQFTEGLVWLSFSSPPNASLNHYTTLVFSHIRQNSVATLDTYCYGDG